MPENEKKANIGEVRALASNLFFKQWWETDVELVPGLVKNLGARAEEVKLLCAIAWARSSEVERLASTAVCDSMAANTLDLGLKGACAVISAAIKEGMGPVLLRKAHEEMAKRPAVDPPSFIHPEGCDCQYCQG